jgi:hypothetical protein
MPGGYHARSLTDGIPVRSMRQLFELALQLEPPWRVLSSDIDFETPTSRSAPGLPGRFAIPMPAMWARLPGRRVHRGHLAPAGRDGVRGACHGAAAVDPLS